MVNLLKSEKNKNDIDEKLNILSYSESVDRMLSQSTIKKSNSIKVSEGLAFLCVKQKKCSLFHRTFGRKLNKENMDKKCLNEFVNISKSLVSKNSQNNALILGSLIYESDLSDKNTPGTVPIFWHKISIDNLKRLYFLDSYVLSVFNPAYLIDEVKDMGFNIESNYSSNSQKGKKTVKTLEHFDLFISYITNFLMEESFVIQSLKTIEKSIKKGGNSKIKIKIQQRV